ncbi:RES family NAD+ phosphorylase [Photorhabdus luminescens]|uniref:RES family NAD+ phosphorylase n=1 Tax=Photorhabdus luminescens TaxID=29488 RepID=UPI00223EE243|nr:RES family NAD+ phosphorylase [Photorhabdus luminescens]MCW7761018.1 RES family NAD+ phosphorylase [Photorhabdus luminescens subsp. venezuelensis]
MVDDEKELQENIPFPPENTGVKIQKWKAGTPIERIHRIKFKGIEFNPGIGNARFSPFKNNGIFVPTIYGGENIGVAIMETILHDIPLNCSGIPVYLGKLDDLARSRIIPRKDIKYVDINPRILKKWGIIQSQLIESEASDYHITRRWAAKIYHDNPDAQAIRWFSKQHGSKAIIIFGDRVKEGDLSVSIESEPAATSKEVNEKLKDLADEMELVLVPKNIT